jgi:hypothetical protein
MATGSLDTNGVWNYGEDDNIALFSDLLNLGTTSTSDAFTSDRARLSTVESNLEATSTFVAASATARDSHWGVPTTGAAQILLQNLGARTVRTDTGYTEQYHGVYNASTNPGGRKTAGWYPVPQTTGLAPIRPTTATFVTGTGTVNSVGSVAFTGVTAVSLNGCFSAAFTHYRIIWSCTNTTTTDQINFRLRAAGADTSSANYYWSGISMRAGGTYGNFTASSTTFVGLAWTATGGSLSGGSLDCLRPNLATSTTGTAQASGQDSGSVAGFVNSFAFSTALSFNGFTIYSAGGAITGTVTVYGYND